MATKKAQATPKRKAAAQKPKAPQTPWQKWSGNPETALADLCDRIVGGETLTAIAKALGTSKPNLIRWIGADPDRSARARDAREEAGSAYVDQAQEHLEAAADQFELAKAKELAHHLRWKASKVNPRDYGDKIEMKQEINLHTLSDEQIDAELARINEKLAAVTGAAGAPTS